MACKVRPWQSAIWMLLVKITLLLLVGFLSWSGMALGSEMADPDGIWEIGSRDSRYRVEVCGPDDNALCGTLVWLGHGANTPDNAQYLNEMIIDHAPKIADGRWRGRLDLFGHSATGTITQTSNDEIELSGCAFFIICRTYALHRVSN